LHALITTITATLGLGYLLWKSEHGKFYPAMPFIAGGSFAGYLLLLLL